MGGFYMSPQVAVIERDLSNYIAGVSTSIAVYVGTADRGPVWQRTNVTNERNFTELFGVPTSITYNGASSATENYEDFFTVASFLSYGNNIYFTRVVDKTDSKNAQVSVDGGSTSLSGSVSAIQPLSGVCSYIEFHNTEEIFNSSGNAFTPSFAGTLSASALSFTAKYPGTYGNNEIKVALVNYATYSAMSLSGASVSALSGYFVNIDDKPESSDEFVVFVLFKNPDATYSIAETFKCSTTANKKDDFGNNMYVETLINSASQYILAFHNTSASYIYPKSFIETSMTGGTNGTTPSDSLKQTGYGLYANPEEVDVNIIIGGANTATATAKAIIALCESRKDCIAVLDVPKSDIVNVNNIATAVANAIDYRKNDLNENTSYAALYANWLLVNDRYNDRVRWIPSSGSVAGIYAHTDEVSESWFAPAGLNRGILKNVIKLAINPDLAYRDQLYKDSVNPIVSFPGQGNVIWGQKTLQTKASAFDRVNVRRLFIVLEKAIATAAKYFIFEANDSFTRSMFKNMIDPFLNDVKGRRGVYDFLVDVSTTVNTPERIDRGEFWTEIFISPVKAAEVLVLRFNATRTGVSFEEFLGK